MSDYPVIADFNGQIRRPSPLRGGMVANFFAANGVDADAVVALARTEYLDSRVDVEISIDGEEVGGFAAYLRRPKSQLSGMVAQFFGQDGEDADLILALGLTRFYDQSARVVVRRVQDADGRDLKRNAPKPYGEMAAALRRSGFFRIPEVWRAIGTDDEFRAWVRRQPSAWSGKFSEEVDGEGRCIAAHVRRAGESGTAYKAEYACIPLTHEEHQAQHDGGESELGGKEWFDQQRIRTVEAWCWARLKSTLGYSSMGDVPPGEVMAWASEEGVGHYLPALYRNFEESQR